MMLAYKTGSAFKRMHLPKGAADERVHVCRSPSSKPGGSEHGHGAPQRVATEKLRALPAEQESAGAWLRQEAAESASTQSTRPCNALQGAFFTLKCPHGAPYHCCPRPRLLKSAAVQGRPAPERRRREMRQSLAKKLQANPCRAYASPEHARRKRPIQGAYAA